MISSYTSICRYNRELYGQLEKLTVQIQSNEGVNYVLETKHLVEKKERLRSLIDNNLERLEALWSRHRKAGRKRPRPRRGSTASKVLDEWFKQPEMSQIKTIACNQALPVATVCKIINAEINKVA